MSFFSDVLESIGLDKPPAPPRPLKRPVSIGSDKGNNDVSKAVSRLGISGNSGPPQVMKRKAEEDVQKETDKTVKPIQSTVPTNVSKPILHSQPVNGKTSTGINPNISHTTAASPTALKVPPKGSFADIMARAKQAQEQRGQNQVGIIKHQAVSKEKISKTALRKREDEEREKARTLKSKLGPRPGLNGRIEKRRSVSPAKKHDQPGPTTKASRPPLQAPASSYKGTMRLGPQKGKPQSSATASRGANSKDRSHKRGRYDEYLGTDEEDDSDLAEEDEDEDDYGSNASSDMEVGAFELDDEDNLALKAAKEDDAREAALENKLKQEKEERRKKLQALANKRK